MLKGYHFLHKGIQPSFPSRDQELLLKLYHEKHSDSKLSDKHIIQSLSLKKIDDLVGAMQDRVSELLEDLEYSDAVDDFFTSLETTKKILKTGYFHYKPQDLIDHPINTIFGIAIAQYDFTYYRSYNVLTDFFNKLARVISAIRDEYQNLDLVKPRKDGSSHLSHAIETTVILIAEIGGFDEDMIYATLMHDFMEDTDHLKQSDKRETMRLILQNTSRPDASHDKVVIPLVQSLTKRPLTSYIRDKEDVDYFTSITTLDDFDEAYQALIDRGEPLDKLRALEKKLKKIREEDYFGDMIDEDSSYNGSNPEEFVFKKFSIKCADRIHALRHMDMSEQEIPLQEQIDMIERKIHETEKYFEPQLQVMIDRSKPNPFYHRHWLRVQRVLVGAKSIGIEVLKKKKQSIKNEHSS